MLTILPALQDAALVSEVRRSRGDGAARVLVLPTRLPSLAEIIMAGADRRAASFRPPVTQLIFPEGEASLPEPPEGGRDADGKQFARDWRAHLIDTLATDVGRFGRAFRDYLAQRFIPSDLRMGASERELIDTIAAQLRLEAEDPDHGVTYYFIARLPEDARARAEREAVLAELKRDFPHIAFLRLAGTEPLNEEVARYGRLRNLIYQGQEPDT